MLPCLTRDILYVPILSRTAAEAINKMSKTLEITSILILNFLEYQFIHFGVTYKHEILQLPYLPFHREMRYLDTLGFH